MLHTLAFSRSSYASPRWRSCLGKNPGPLPHHIGSGVSGRSDPKMERSDHWSVEAHGNWCWSYLDRIHRSIWSPNCQVDRNRFQYMVSGYCIWGYTWIFPSNYAKCLPFHLCYAIENQPKGRHVVYPNEFGPEPRGVWARGSQQVLRGRLGCEGSVLVGHLYPDTPWNCLRTAAPERPLLNNHPWPFLGSPDWQSQMAVVSQDGVLNGG